MPARPASTSSAAARPATARARHAHRHDRRCCPGPAPKEGDKFPPNKTYYEIPIAIQDRAFNTDGSLFYPDTRAFFDGVTGPYIPDTDLSPIWNPEFFGNTIMVNGNTWPFQTVEQRRYRFRFLNGCQSRFLILDFSDIPGVEVWQIGNEGGFLAAPVNLTATNGNRLLMGLAERADVIVDFTNVPLGNYVLGNVGPDEPFGGGDAGRRLRRRRSRHDRPGHAVPRRAGRGARSDDAAAVPALPAIAPLPAPTATRPLALIEMMSMYFDDGPAEAMLGTWSATARRRRCTTMWVDAGHREPRGRRHRGLGVLQLHRRRPPDARPRGGVRGGQPPGAGASTRTGETGAAGRSSRRPAAAGAVGERLQGHGHRLPGRGHPHQGAVRQRRASSSGTATSSSTRTTR